MIQDIISSILTKLNMNNSFTQTELLEIRYSILAIGGDLSKLIIMGFIFLKLGNFTPFLYSMVTTIPLRTIIGGFHLKNYWNCLFFSFIYFELLILSSEWIAYHYVFYALSFASLVILMLAPLIPSSSDRTLKIPKATTKALAFILIMIFSILFIIKKDPIYYIGPLSIIFQSIQLILIKGVKSHEKHKTKKLVL